MGIVWCVRWLEARERHRNMHMYVCEHVCMHIPAWMVSVRTHMTPKALSMPRYGGSPVRALNTGTESSPVWVMMVCVYVYGGMVRGKGMTYTNI